jgi:hypothetical protein
VQSFLPRGRQWRGRLVAGVLLAALNGCATSVFVTPQVTGPFECRVRGHLSYTGTNAEYVPTVLSEDPASPADAVLRYSYRVDYDLRQLPAEVQWVNPLHLVGMPTGTGALTIASRLDVMRGGLAVRSFAAVASMKRSQSMFSEGETFTDMRRRGLLLVRDNIAAQVCADLATTQAILDAPAYPSASASDQ